MGARRRGAAYPRREGNDHQPWHRDRARLRGRRFPRRHRFSQSRNLSVFRPSDRRRPETEMNAVVDVKERRDQLLQEAWKAQVNAVTVATLQALPALREALHVKVEPTTIDGVKVYMV